MSGWKKRRERRRQYREDCELLGIEPECFYIGENLSGPAAIKRDAANLRWRRKLEDDWAALAPTQETDPG